MADNTKGPETQGSGTEVSKATEQQPKEGVKKSNRGFAAMDPQQQREIARKGGTAVSANSEHMSNIGRKGGEASRGGKGAART
jgi:uncharacterized protein